MIFLLSLWTSNETCRCVCVKCENQYKIHVKLDIARVKIDILAINNSMYWTENRRIWNLPLVWIDHRFFFETKSHSLLKHLLRTLEVPDPLLQYIPAGNDKISTKPITFKRGMFQGDFLSPLLFCILLLYILVSLRKTIGYYCAIIVDHLEIECIKSPTFSIYI